MPTFTMRLADEDHEALQAVALLEGRPMAELVREAIIHYVRSYAQSQPIEERIKAEQERYESAARVLQMAAEDAGARVKVKTGRPPRTPLTRPTAGGGADRAGRR